MGSRRTRAILILAAVAFIMALGAVVYLWRAPFAGQLVAQMPPSNPEESLARLRAGNARFVMSARVLSTDTTYDAAHRKETAHEQHPFATVLCCSDSRVVPEFIFDQGTGSIFEIRNAGNVVDEDVMASVEYAVDHFHVPLVVVLGHKGCGAIKAVWDAGERPLPDHLRDLQRHMEGIRTQLPLIHEDHAPEHLDRLCKENARQQALTLLKDCRALQDAVNAGETRLMYAIYDMETGAVDFFDLH